MVESSALSSCNATLYNNLEFEYKYFSNYNGFGLWQFLLAFFGFRRYDTSKTMLANSLLDAGGYITLFF